MRRIVWACWSVVIVLVFALTACGGTSSTQSPSTKAATTATATIAPPATPTPPPAATIVYVGVGSDLYALDARTGSLRWKYDTGQPTNMGNIQSTFVGAGTVFFNDYANNSLYAVDATTGTMRWRTHVIGIATELTVVQGVVYATSINVQDPEATYAINLQSGAVLWQISGGGGAMVVTSDAGYFAGVLAGSDAEPPTNGYVRAYDRLTGSQLWQVTGHPFVGLQIGGDVLYTTAGNTLYAYDAHSGASLWTSSFDSPVGMHQLIGNTLYLGSNTLVFALDATTHKVLWQFAVAYGDMSIGDNMVCLANHGNLYGLNAATGAKLWSMQSTDGYASVTYGSGLCYANTFSNDRSPLYAVDPATGALRWSRDVKYIYSGLQPSGNAIYVISQATAQCCAPLITALSSSDGSTLWTFAPPTQFPGQFILG